MADRRMYVPPHRRPSTLHELNTARPPLFENSIMDIRRLRLQSPSEVSDTDISSDIAECGSIRKGRGRFALTLDKATTWTSLFPDPDQDDDDLNDASAQYSISTDRDRSTGESTTTPLALPMRSPPSLPPSPLPRNPVRLGENLLPSTPLPLPRRTWPTLSSLPRVPQPLIERIGPVYIPPSRRTGFVRQLQSAPWWQAETLRRQRTNLRANREPGPSRVKSYPPTFTQVAALYHDLGEVVVVLKTEELVLRLGEKIAGVQYVGSYKWIDGEKGVPTLAVPAVPDIWDPPRLVGQLGLDKDIPQYEEFPDYASALLPPSLSTLEPLFLCLDSPEVLRDIDLVTGRNNLRKLWSALRPNDNQHLTPFRIDIQYIPDTEEKRGMVLLERFEPPERSRARQTPSGFHQSYLEATTRKVLHGSDRTPGCNRVIKYSFGGLEMLVKFDTPAYVLDGKNRTKLQRYSAESLYDDCSDEGQASMDGLDFDDPVFNGQSIKIRHTTLIPPSQASLVSIKTKQHLDPFDAEYHFPQMYFSQTPRVIYARHSAGNFKFPIEEYDLFNDVVRQEVREERQIVLDRMGGMLRWIVTLVRKQKRGLGLIWDGRAFSVCEREGGPQLSCPVTEMISDVRSRGGVSELNRAESF